MGNSFQSWLRHIYQTFERLSEDFGEYAAFVEKEGDKSYNPDLTSRELADFMDLVKAPPKPGGGSRWLSLSLIIPSKRLKESELVIGAKWALFRGDRLRRVLAKFQKRNQALQDILPLAIASWLQRPEYSNSQNETVFIDKMSADEDAKRLGLSKHAQIRGLIRNPTFTSSQEPELHLRNSRIISTLESYTRTAGSTKNINSHSVVFFQDLDSEHYLFNDPYLVDFESSRPDTDSSLRLVDHDYEHNLYRHPDIQVGNRPSSS